MTISSDSVAERFVPTPDTHRRLRTAFGRFATGVTVVTTAGPDGPVGMTANSFSSVSLEPPLVLWCIDKGSDRFDIFSVAQRYAIHILAEDQEALSTGFAKDPGYFDHAAWSPGADGVPSLGGVLARFDCRLHKRHEAGDHLILVGEVLSVEMTDANPLAFAMGGYQRLSGSN